MQASTRLAALRTGKIDRRVQLTWEQAEGLAQTSPELLQNHGLGVNTDVLYLRVDKKPFDDIRVRRVLAMAIDRRSIVKDFYKGAADLVGWRILPGTDAYTPFENLPPELQQLYEYNPQKAKQLLAEAGYSNGFQTNTLVNPLPGIKDLAIMVAGYWEAIGVKTELSFPASAPYYGMANARTYDTIFYRGNSWNPDSVASATGVFASGANTNMFWGLDEKSKPNYSDPEMDRRIQEIIQTTDLNTQTKLKKEQNLFCMSKVYGIEMPVTYSYNVWQPWLKGYYGAAGLGEVFSYEGMYWLCWVDQDLKEVMTGKR